MNDLQYDRTGKLDLGKIYNRPRPVDYYTTLSRLDYRIPQEAQPFFARTIEAIRHYKGNRSLRLVDVGCSYGVNAALLRYAKTMDELYRHFASLTEATDTQQRRSDRAFFAEPRDRDLGIVGIDTAANAVRYAVDARLLAGAVTTNLESREPAEADRKLLAGTDLVVSTGCFGYVSESTLERIIEASGQAPWMAHFVLRMFNFDKAREMLEDHGYVVEKVRGIYPQRRFVSDDEQAHTLENLRQIGVDDREPEMSGWYFAELFVARPRAAAKSVSLDAMFGDLVKPIGRH